MDDTYEIEVDAADVDWKAIAEEMQREINRLRAAVKQARVYLDQTEGHAVTFAEGLARATLVVMLDELGYRGDGVAQAVGKTLRRLQ